MKADAVPVDWAENKRHQKDVDARWTKKNNENHYGYKNHINADQAHKLVQDYAVTDAAVHDSQVFAALLDQTSKEEGNKRTVYADSAYRSQEHEAKLAADNHLREGHAWPSTDRCAKGKQPDRIKSTVRARVEHVFGAQAQMGGHIVRTIGLAKARVKIGMMNLVYNMKRLMQLIRRDRTGASAMV
ncbi:MAG: transposase [Gammaproteobacteria bacterium]